MKGRGSRAQLAVAALLLGIWLVPAWPQAQSGGGAGVDALANLLAQVNQLYEAGKYAEAIPVAERYAKAIEVRYGTAGSEYALALNNLAELLRLTNRFDRAEPLIRRALTIDEKSL